MKRHKLLLLIIAVMFILYNLAYFPIWNRRYEPPDPWYLNAMDAYNDRMFKKVYGKDPPTNPFTDEKEVHTWFRLEYDRFDQEWNKLMDDINHQVLPTPYAEAKVIQSEMIPWIQELMRQTQVRDDVIDKEQKLALLKIRLLSAEHLAQYSNSYYASKDDYQGYIELDNQLKSLIASSSMIINR